MEAWIFRIAHNIVVDHLRKRSRRPASVPIDEALALAGKSDPAREVERSNAGSDRGRKRTPQVLRAIDACLRALRDEETGRLLVRRSDIDEMTEEQLARAQTALASLGKRVADLRRLLR